MESMFQELVQEYATLTKGYDALCGGIDSVLGTDGPVSCLWYFLCRENLPNG